ncbi:MAG: hypothetical protein AAFX76_03570 [Planctomycetota bacterium]
MTTDREATCWMLAAMAVVVWAASTVGCSATQSDAFGGETWAAGPAAAQGVPVEVVGVADYWEVVPASGRNGAATPDVRGLSIAAPLVEERDERGASAVGVLRAAYAWAVEAEGGVSPWSVAGGATGWPSGWREPRAGAIAGAGASTLTSRDRATLGVAGLVASLLGAMVLLFGVEAVVKLIQGRRRVHVHRTWAWGGAALETDEDEVSVFRLPEPMGDGEVAAASVRRAA